MPPDQVLDFVAGFRDSPVLGALKLLFLQEICSVEGTAILESDSWYLIHGKTRGEWRGCAVLFHKDLGHHESSRSVLAATSTVLRFPSGKKTGLISGHVSHKFTIADTAEALREWGETPAATCPKLLLGMDANEVFLHPGGFLGGVTLSTTGRGEQIMQWAMEHDVLFPPQEIDVSSHFPYNPLLRPRRLDYIATRGHWVSDAVVGQFRDRARSDHEPVLGTVLLPEAHTKDAPPTWGPRRLRKNFHEHLDLGEYPLADAHAAIALAAKTITEPAGRSSNFKESKQLKALRRTARDAPPGAPSRQAWKTVQRCLQSERRAWKQKLLDRAGSMDWMAFRTVKRGMSSTNWASYLVDDSQWQAKLTRHMQSIFAKQPPGTTADAMANLRAQVTGMCKMAPWRPFTESEMRITMATWKNNKATGVDGVAHEALRILFDQKEWQTKIAELLNDAFYKGELSQALTEGASVLLPKASLPQDWSDTRPITLSNTLLKWLSQLLLLRGMALLETCCFRQWASRSKQSVELILSLRKLARVAHEWKTPFYIIKIDLKKAFDSVAQEKLGDLVFRKIACEGGMPWEARLWFSILQAREINFYVQKQKVTIDQTNGVRQGSPDSPVLFASAIGEVLDASIDAVNGGRPPQVQKHEALAPPPHSGATFMDDTYLWGESAEYVQSILSELERRLLELGLVVNPNKTQVFLATFRVTPASS